VCSPHCENFLITKKSLPVPSLEQRPNNSE
jgi:hypothetical protein